MVISSSPYRSFRSFYDTYSGQVDRVSLWIGTANTFRGKQEKMLAIISIF